MATAPALQATVIIPANDEAAFIGPCLKDVLASSDTVPFEVIVVANGCTDATVSIARDIANGAQNPARPVQVIETPSGGKPGALQLGDAAAQGATRIYLDADVRVGPGLIPALIAALDTGPPRYASGRPRVAPAQSRVTRLYARFWQSLPFFSTGVPGFGLFAMNGSGRARWGSWPDIISDDTFARLNFAPDERIQVPHSYSWPMIEGLAGLIRVRRRQDRGVREIARRFPGLLRNADPGGRAGRHKARAALHDPAGFLVYAAVALATRWPARGSTGWERGR